MNCPTGEPLFAWQPLWPFLVSAGALVTGTGLVALAFVDRRREEVRKSLRPASDPVAQSDPEEEPARGRLWILGVGVAVVAGTVGHLHGLGADSLGHVEMYVPGIPLPDGLSEPPPRLTLADAIRWHFHCEPHPVGWYVLGLPWTTLFGTSAEALRLPAALLGSASIGLIARAAWLSYGRSVASVAALLLAAHGYHLFYSQHARMYVPGCFFGLIATILLLEIASTRRRRGWLEATYVGTMVVGTQTVEYFWACLALHIAWSVAFQPRAPLRPAAAGEGAGSAHWLAGLPRIVSLQWLAAVLCLPGLLQAAYTARQGVGGRVDLAFITEYLSFGFALPVREAASAGWPASMTLRVAVLSVAVVLIGLGLRAAPRITRLAEPAGPPLPLGPLVVVALGEAVFLLGLATTLERRGGLLAFSLLPLAMLAVLPIAALVARSVRALESQLPDRPGWTRTIRSPITMMAFGSLVFLSAASLVIGMLAPRAFLFFSPYLLVLIAAGLVSLRGRPIVRALAGIAVAMILGMSVVWARILPQSPRDYRGTGDAIAAQLRPHDLVFVRPQHWLTTPLLYYLPNDRLVGRDFREALARQPDAHVWVTRPDSVPALPEITRALQGYRLAETVESRRVMAERWVRED